MSLGVTRLSIYVYTTDHMSLGVTCLCTHTPETALSWHLWVEHFVTHKFVCRDVATLFLVAIVHLFMKGIICFNGISELEGSYSSLVVPLKMMWVCCLPL